METLQEHTAILLFTRSAGEEAAVKSLTNRNSRIVNKKIISCLIGHTRKVAESSGMPVFDLSAEPQVGKTFGERLAYSFNRIFSKGYSRVICIGNDCPELRKADLLEARLALENAEIVLGPSTDGGTYLIGMRLEAFDPEMLASIRWQTSDVYNELRLFALRQQIRTYSLPAYSDVDSASDLIPVMLKLPEKSRLRVQVFELLFEQASHRLLFFILRTATAEELQRLLLRPMSAVKSI